MLRMRKERIDKGLTQTDLAFKLKIQPSRISNIENGYLKPFKPSQEKLEKFFGLPIDELLKEIK